MKTPLFCMAVAGLLLIISLIGGANNLQAAEASAAAGYEEAGYQAFKGSRSSMNLEDLKRELEGLKRDSLKQLVECPTVTYFPPLSLNPFLERLINEKEGEEFTGYYKSFEDDALLEVYVKNFTGDFLTTGGTRFAEEKIAYEEITKRGLCEQLNTLVAQQELEKKALAAPASS